MPAYLKKKIEESKIKTIKLCFKYNCNCNRCPRNRKCEEEIKKEDKLKGK